MFAAKSEEEEEAEEEEEEEFWPLVSFNQLINCIFGEDFPSPSPSHSPNPAPPPLCPGGGASWA